MSDNALFIIMMFFLGVASVLLGIADLKTSADLLGRIINYALIALGSFSVVVAIAMVFACRKINIP